MLLPEIPNERDACVARIINALQYKRGIDKIHILPEEENKKAQLCFHYDPSAIALNEVEQIAKKAGADLTEHYGHLLIETTGIRHPRHARIIEAALKKQKGMLTASVSGTGLIQLEYNKEAITAESILPQIKKEG